MLDKNLIGHEFPSFTAEVEKGRLKFFAKAIGETDPIYTDEAAALAAGYRALPAPRRLPWFWTWRAMSFCPSWTC